MVVNREIIRVRPIRTRIEGDDVGYIRITQFNEQTTEDLHKAIDEITTRIGDKLKGYVIDLRNNPGGLMDQAVSVADTFLEQGRSSRRADANRKKCSNSMPNRAT